MKPQLRFNDSWESIPLDCVDDAIDFLDQRLQATHPLRQFKLFPLAKCWRKHKYFVEEEEPTDNLWILDMHKKKRIKGKTYYYFRLLESQDDLDQILAQDYQDWVQSMKDAGAWHGE